MSEPDAIFLDYNATPPLLPEVLDATLPYLRTRFGNPSSDHVYGTHARSAVARARQRVAVALGCDDDEVVFTSGGTEANNLAIRGIAQGRRSTVVTTVVEHPATAGPCASGCAPRRSRLDVIRSTDGSEVLPQHDQTIGLDERELATARRSRGLKIAVSAPMPSARMVTATAVKPGVRAQRAEGVADVAGEPVCIVVPATRQPTYER